MPPPTISDRPDPWLERNWTPREPFDPTPWLQERYKRQQEAKLLPLKLQGMALENAQKALQIEHAAIVNEMQGTQLQQYQSELPAFDAMVKESGGDPKYFLSGKLQSFRSPTLQKQYLDLVGAATDSEYGLVMKQRVIEDARVETDLLKRGGRPIKRLDNGMFDKEDLAAVAAEVSATEHADKLAEINARNAWHTNAGLPEGKALLEVVDYGNGIKKLVNNKTGAVHNLENNVSKPVFLSQHLSAFMRDQFVDEKEATTRLSALYDESIAPHNAPAKATALDGKVRVVHPDGRTGRIPAAQLKQALEQGFKEAP